MEGEIVFYSQRDLDEWRPRPRGLVAELQADTTSPLGQLYAKWNEANQRARDEYERRNYEIWRSDRVWKG
jgi:hypothetical protein